MANCKDNCIHYKVCMYGDLTEYKTEQILKDDCDDFMPKDVVPKNEVKGLYKEIDRLSQVVLYYDSFKADEIIDAKQEVAREIFEEIDELLVQNATMQIATSTLHCKLAELKKKYTEEKQ